MVKLKLKTNVKKRSPAKKLKMEMSFRPSLQSFSDERRPFDTRIINEGLSDGGMTMHVSALRFWK